MKSIIIVFLGVTIITWLLVTWIFVTFWLLFSANWSWNVYLGFWLLVEGSWLLLLTGGSYSNKEDK